jgi:P4 family phage/plasmid primase-like protien
VTACCPDRAGRRGRPYTAHWFVWHDAQGGLDLGATAEPGGLPRSDVALAQSVRMMTAEAGSPMLCGSQSGAWLLWDGSVYAPQDAEYANRMTLWAAQAHWQAAADVAAAEESAIAVLPAAGQARARADAKARWGRAFALRDRIWSDAGQAALARQLARECGIDEKRLDVSAGEIVLDNGRVSCEQILRDGRVALLPHDRAKLDTKRCSPGVAYDPDARAPWFRRFLETSVADEAQRDWLLWRAASALFGRMPRKGFVNSIGERDSGKSTFTDLVAELAGGYAKTVPAETFLSKHQGDAGFRQAELRGARFVHTHEPSPGSRYDEGLMKTLTGRDRQRTAGKYEKPVEWTPQLTVFIGSNAPIRFASSDDAFMTRQEVVAFARGYAAPDDDIGLRLRGELSGILNELLAMIRREAWHGVPKLPQSSIDARERMAEEVEGALGFVAEWIEDGRLIVKPDASAYSSVTVQRLYAWYVMWCDEAGERPVGRKTFAAIVGRRYPRVLSDGRYHFRGIIYR